MISGPSTRKGALDGKIRAPCIRNRPIAAGNGRIGRGSCHLDLEKHAFRADIAGEGAFFAHSARKGCMRRDSCQPGPRCRRNARDGGGSAGRGGRAARQARRHGPEPCRHDARGHRGALPARCAWPQGRDAAGAMRRNGRYSLKCASITATRSFSASMSC